jgi:hypothetical protein
MNIDTEHLHHWMQAIRQSPDPMRTMDAFWSGQLRSKEWLIDCLDEHVHHSSSIDIHGGWVGVLASMIFQSNIPVTTIRSIDIDSSCESIANMMNRQEYLNNKFRAVTANMCEIRSDADISINTSFEHISQDDYDLWLSGLKHNSLIVLQTNNYEIPEHIRISKNLEEFKEQAGLEKVLYSGELELPLYKRFMIIGYKNV